jgi:hypothetical protein
MATMALAMDHPRALLTKRVVRSGSWTSRLMNSWMVPWILDHQLEPLLTAKLSAMETRCSRMSLVWTCPKVWLMVSSCQLARCWSHVEAHGDTREEKAGTSKASRL